MLIKEIGLHFSFFVVSLSAFVDKASKNELVRICSLSFLFYGVV
jgi:hypothetical protein